MNHKPNKATLKLMRQAANNLPVVVRREKKTVSGLAILKENPDFTLKDGSKPKEDWNYSFEADMPVNHYRLMKQAYAKDGMEGVEAYLQSIVRQCANSVKGQNDVMRGLQERMATSVI